MFVVNNNYIINPIRLMTLLLICTSLVFSLETAQASDQFIFKSPPKNQTIAGLSKGKSFTNGEQRFVLLPELYSRMNKHSKSNLSKKSESLFQQKGPYTILKNKQSKQKKWYFNNSQPKDKIFPVALNKRTNKLVIITGNLIIKTTEVTDIKKIMLDYSLKPTKIFKHLKLFFVEFSNFNELLNQVEILKKDPRIQRVEIEIIENPKKPL